LGVASVPVYYIDGMPLDCTNIILVGGLNPSQKYESQLGILLPIYGKS
jgi:hypothetical protein